MKVINPVQLDAFRRLSIRKTKNDSKDSLVIAQLMRFGEYSTTRLSEENIHALKQLSRYHSIFARTILTEDGLSFRFQSACSMLFRPIFSWET